MQNDYTPAFKISPLPASPDSARKTSSRVGSTRSKRVFSMPACCSAVTQLRSVSAERVGLARAVCRIEPPSLWMYATPVIYPVSSIPEQYRPIILVNPLTPVVEAFRYASEGFAQFANAITVIVSALSIGATLLVDRANKSNQPWLEKR